MRTPLRHAPSGWSIFWRAAGQTAAAIGLFTLGVVLAMAVCRFLGI
ncbi:MAG: hypothetical protein J6X61_04305 [Clostridia bacterium]|nr:hypothetical protein [Clostridia bacterium]